ncbi:hypothetical protein NMY22_g6895 [Coprinellus aureogranulatus]|nr:hypothetical protein NMY22_g6895 [Coprinellus aureogranulatus]
MRPSSLRLVMQSSQDAFHSLFVPKGPHQASAILLLIENSVAMAAIWSDIRERCLEPLLAEFDQTNRRYPTKVFAVEALPVSSAMDRDGYNGVHRGLNNIRFNESPSNRLSTAKVNAAIDLLSTVTYDGRPVTLHLILVAASSPIENPLLGIRQYAWFLLAEKLQQVKHSPFPPLLRPANQSIQPILNREKFPATSSSHATVKICRRSLVQRWLQGATEVLPFVEWLDTSRYLLKFAAQPAGAQGQQSGHHDDGTYDGFPLHIPVESTPSVDDIVPMSNPSSTEPIWGATSYPSSTEPVWGATSYNDPGSSEPLTGEAQGYMYQPSSLDPFFAYPGFSEDSLDPTPSGSQLPSPPSFANWLSYNTS